MPLKRIFFLRPKQKPPSDTAEPWYEKVAIGNNTLSTMVKDMCAEAGIKGKTNHSMRASGATAMFQQNVRERVIQKVTGHHSLDALRAYERISTLQHTEVSKILMNNDTKSSSTSVLESSKSPDLSGIALNNCSIGQININMNQNATEK